MRERERKTQLKQKRMTLLHCRGRLTWYGKEASAQGWDLLALPVTSGVTAPQPFWTHRRWGKGWFRECLRDRRVCSLSGFHPLLCCASLVKLVAATHVSAPSVTWGWQCHQPHEGVLYERLYGKHWMHALPVLSGVWSISDNGKTAF